jgi:nuclear pore complex protein Nup133
MDVDSVVSDRSFIQRPAAETVFAKSEELSVSFYANLPVEVKQVLKNAG